MATTEEHIINIIRYLDPEQGECWPERALSEAKDALTHYRVDKETWKSKELIKET